jgi:hypothetical protein
MNTKCNYLWLSNECAISSKIGPLKSMRMKKVIHEKSSRNSLPVSEDTTGTSNDFAAATTSGL